MKWQFALLEIDNSTDHLIEEPIGWSDIVFSIKRDPFLHGIFFEFSTPLKFYGDAYALIRDEYELNGVAGFFRLFVKYQCNDTDEFADFYNARLNFTKIQFIDEDICLVELPIEDDSCLTLFKSRQDQKVDLHSLVSFDGDALDEYDFLNKTISLPPKGIYKHLLVRANTTGELEIDYEDVEELPSGSSCDYAERVSYISLGFSNVELNELDQLNTLESVWVSSAVDVKTMFKCNDPGIYTIDFTIFADFFIDLTADTDACGLCDTDGDKVQGLHIGFFISVNDIVVYTNWYIDTTTYCQDNHDNSHTFFNDPQTITLAQDDELKMYLYIKTEGSWEERLLSKSHITFTHNVNLYNLVTKVNITALVLLPATNCKVNLINEAFSRTVESITNNCLKVYSEYFGREDSSPFSTDTDGCGSLECITNGLLIRQYVLAKHFVSFKELFDGANAIHNLGMGIEDISNDKFSAHVLRIEPYKYFYDSSVILICDKVPSIKRSNISEEIYSIFQFGYAKWEAEQYTGLDEFCTKREYRTSLQQVKNTLAQVCGFIASGYAIEVTRDRIYATDSQSDWRYDNDNFIICLVRDGGDFNVEQNNIVSGANLIDPPSVYNFRISPNRNALRWLSKVLASYADPTNADGLIFSSGSGNILAEGWLTDSCTVETTVLSEEETNLTTSDLADPSDGLPVYIPQLWEFEFPMSIADYLDVVNNPRGIIQVRYGQQDNFVDCYIRQVDYQPNKGLASFKLLPKFVS